MNAGGGLVDLSSVSTMNRSEYGAQDVGETSPQSRSVAEPARRDPPLHQKVGMLVSLSCAAGLGLGVHAQLYEDRFWQIAGVSVLVPMVLWWVGHWWVSRPYRHLAEQAERISKTGMRSALKHLPVGRRDEIGRIAQSLHAMGVHVTRSNLQTLTLRRTLDQRITSATRRATTELSRLVMQDALTGLGNRRFLDEHVGATFDAAEASGTDLACVMIDLDHFKRVNDTLGHEAGDHLLVFLGGLIRATTRPDDMAVRLGGDEFVLVMPGADQHRGKELMEQVRKLFVRQTRAMFPDVKELDISYGVSSLEADKPKDASALMRLADRRLYAMKH